jgi:hypothetical protein
VILSKRGRGEPVHDIQPKLRVPVRADALIAEKHGVRDHHDAPLAKPGANDQTGLRRIRARRSLPRELRVRSRRHNPTRAVEARVLDAVRERRAAVRLAEKPLGVFMDARGAVDGCAVFDPQSGGREKVVEIVAVFVVLVFRDHQQPAARADKRKDARDLARGQHRRAPRSGALPARVARVRQHQHTGPGERGTFERFRQIAGHGEIARGEQFGCTLIR